MANRVTMTTEKQKSWFSKPLSSDILEYRVPIETNVSKNVRGKDVWEPFQVERMCRILEGQTSHCLIRGSVSRAEELSGHQTMHV